STDCRRAAVAAAEVAAGAAVAVGRRPWIIRRQTPPSTRGGAPSAFLAVGRRQAVDQLVKCLLDLVRVASHQNSVLQRVGAERLDLLDVLVQDLDLFEAGNRLTVRLPPYWRRACRRLGNPRIHHFDPVPLNMNLASSSVKEIASCVWVISPPALIMVLSPPGSSTTTMLPSSDSLTILALVSAGMGTL